MVMTPEMIARMKARQDAISQQFADARKYGSPSGNAQQAAREAAFEAARQQREAARPPKTSLEQRQAMKEDVIDRVAQLEKIGKAPRQLEKQLMQTARKEVFQPIQKKIGAMRDPETGDISEQNDRQSNLLQNQLSQQKEYFKDLGRTERSNMLQGMRREAGLNAPNYRGAPENANKKGFVPGKLSSNPFDTKPGGLKKGGKVKKYKSGGAVSSASKRADGCATKGKTKGRIV